MRLVHRELLAAELQNLVDVVNEDQAPYPRPAERWIESDVAHVDDDIGELLSDHLSNGGRSERGR